MSDRITVCLRLRPLPHDATDKSVAVRAVSETTAVCGTRRTFLYDRVFDTTDSSEAVFNERGSPMISSFAVGLNCCILGYGATFGGKTYTISALTKRVVASAIAQEDIATLSFSYVELYGDTLRDLLGAQGDAGSCKPLQLHEVPGQGAQIIGAVRVRLRSESDVLRLLSVGERARATAATGANKVSSRSHSFFVIYSSRTMNKFTLVDLAGSERNKKTGNAGARFQESIGINSGLLALGGVIRALSSQPLPSHVPYRSSKLTRVLQDSLGGNSRTLMIACVSVGLTELDESIRTMQYASKAMHIHNDPIPTIAVLQAEQQVAHNEAAAAAAAHTAAEVQELKTALDLAHNTIRDLKQTLKKDEVIFANNLRVMKKLKSENRSLHADLEAVREKLRKIEAPDCTPPTAVKKHMGGLLAPDDGTSPLHTQTQMLADNLDARDGVVTCGYAPTTPAKQVPDSSFREMLADNLYLRSRCAQLSDDNRSLANELSKIHELLSQ